MAAPGEEPRLSLRLAAFERAFDELNAAYFDGRLGRPVITVSPTPSAYGHFTPWRSWASGEDAFHEINLGAETIGRPVAASAAKRLSSTRKYTCPRCGMSVRATRAVRVKCVECDEELTCDLP